MYTLYKKCIHCIIHTAPLSLTQSKQKIKFKQNRKETYKQIATTKMYMTWEKSSKLTFAIRILLKMF